MRGNRVSSISFIESLNQHFSFLSFYRTVDCIFFIYISLLYLLQAMEEQEKMYTFSRHFQGGLEGM